MKPRYRPKYEVPAIDSPRAIANAQTLLCGAVSIDQWTPDSLAHQFRLSVKRAEYMLTVETQRREARHG
jgi:hypothetical protein